MIDGKLHYEGDIYYKGKRIPNATIDTCKLGGRYETMCFKGGIEYDVIMSDTLDDAITAYKFMLSTFTKAPEKPIEKPLTGKYKKLSEDLKAAIETAKLFDNGEDGGTCNFDAPAIIAPRWHEDKVKQAAEEAGTHAFKWDGFGQTKFVFSPPTSGQANRRSRVADAMEQALKDLGYQTIGYAALD